MRHWQGGCHCGNLHLDIELSRPPETLTPRACDCDFCHAHGAAYVSDPQGRLSITIRDESLVRRYRQGDDIADMLICSGCGILVGALFVDGRATFGTVNVRALDRTIPFGGEQTASPKLLEAEDKVDRWKQLWFREVVVRSAASSSESAVL